MQEFNFDSENFKNNPESKYDSLIVKQNCVNDALNNQVQAARDKLTKLSHSLKNIDVCGKGNKEDVSGFMKSIFIITFLSLLCVVIITLLLFNFLTLVPV